MTSMVAHMNDDHADSVLFYVHRFAALPAARSARLIAIEPEHMSIEATFEGDVRTVEVPFDHVLLDAGDARNTLIAMARASKA